MVKQNGFMLTEILIVLVIVAILTVALMPAFRSYVLKSRREDAMKTILYLQVAEEKYRTTNATYGTLTNLGASTTSLDGYYTMSIPTNTATAYTITATAAGTQASDTTCSTFTLTYSAGTATKSSSSDTTCWTQ